MRHRLVSVALIAFLCAGGGAAAAKPATGPFTPEQGKAFARKLPKACTAMRAKEWYGATAAVWGPRAPLSAWGEALRNAAGAGPAPDGPVRLEANISSGYTYEGRLEIAVVAARDADGRWTISRVRKSTSSQPPPPPPPPLPGEENLPPTPMPTFDGTWNVFEGPLDAATGARIDAMLADPCFAAEPGSVMLLPDSGSISLTLTKGDRSLPLGRSSSSGLISDQIIDLLAQAAPPLRPRDWGAYRPPLLQGPETPKACIAAGRVNTYSAEDSRAGAEQLLALAQARLEVPSLPRALLDFDNPTRAVAVLRRGRTDLAALGQDGVWRRARPDGTAEKLNGERIGEVEAAFADPCLAYEPLLAAADPVNPPKGPDGAAQHPCKYPDLYTVLVRDRSEWRVFLGSCGRGGPVDALVRAAWY